MGQVTRALGFRPVTYDPGPPSLDLCAGGIRPGTAHLSARMHEVFPVRDIPGNGYNCRPVNHDPSNPPSVHGSGRADDLGMPLLLDGRYVEYGTDGAVFDTSVGDRCSEFLTANCADPEYGGLGVQYIVFNRRSWSPNRVPGWRAYTGSLSHVDHLHFEQNRLGAEMTPAQIDAVFIRAGLLPDPTAKEYQMIVLDPFDERPNPTDPRFARLLADRRTVRAANGARIGLGADGAPAREIRLPFEAEAIVPHHRNYSKGRFVAIQKNGRAGTGLRFIGG